MKNILLVAALAGALGGVAATVATKAVSSVPAGGTSEESVALSPGGSGTDDELRSQLEALKRENDKLALRLAAVELRKDSRREEIVGEGGQNLSALQEQIAELAAALKNPQSAQAAGLRTMVATAMEEVRDMESEERRLEREQRDIERIRERMDEYATKLGLNAVQKQSMQNVLVDENARRNELFTTMRDGNADRSDIRTTFTTLRDETTAKLSNILTPIQLEDYNSMSDDRGGRFFGGGPGPGGGGRGGRGGAQAGQSSN
jgi:hypothetical protein